RSERDELGRVAPVRDPADAADRNADLLLARERRDHVERDRLHRGTAVAAVRRRASDARVWHEAIEIDADEALDRVDEGDAVAPARRDARLDDVAGVRRELHEDRRPRELLRPARDLRQKLRLLSDRRSHPALAHPVRAPEVELEAVAAGVLDLLDQGLPVVLR